MRLIRFLHLVWVAMALISFTPVAAQENGEITAIAMDQPTADLWRLHHPDTKLVVVVISDSESYETVNQRAFAIRDVAKVFYRSDQSSQVSQFFRDRLANQGVRTIDLFESILLKDRRWRCGIQGETLRMAQVDREQKPAAGPTF